MWRLARQDHRLVSQNWSGNLLSYVALDESSRTFRDKSGRKWIAERVGRTSGIVTGKSMKSLPAPADILRFTCEDDGDEAERESTINAGALAEIDEAELQKILDGARKLRIRPK